MKATSTRATVPSLQVARALRPLGWHLRGRDPDPRPGRRGLKREDGCCPPTATCAIRAATTPTTPCFQTSCANRWGSAIGWFPTKVPSFSQLKIPANSRRREEEQAELIVRRALDRDPHARVLIYCGIHHAAKGELASEQGQHLEWMAMVLKRTTGIDPLVVDQATLEVTPAYKPDVDLYALAALYKRRDAPLRRSTAANRSALACSAAWSTFRWCIRG